MSQEYTDENISDLKTIINSDATCVDFSIVHGETAWFKSRAEEW